MSVNHAKPVGRTASGYFQVGVRRTFPISVEEAWDFILSSEGVKVWLGEPALTNFAVGRTFATKSGISGEIRVMNPHTNIRMSWGMKDWPNASTVQIRTIAVDPRKTTISFHQENLPDAQAREEMKRYWEEVLDKIKEIYSMKALQ
jgi:activator of HSP90 ATPase